MPDALARLYNRYDCRPPKHLLEAALTGRSQVEIAIATLRGQARWNTAKARDWERAARLAAANGHPLRARLQRGDARFHRAIALPVPGFAKAGGFCPQAGGGRACPALQPL